MRIYCNLKGEKRKGKERKRERKKEKEVRRKTYIEGMEIIGIWLRIYRFDWAASGNNTGKRKLEAFLHLSSEAQASVWLKCYILGSKDGLGLDSGNLYYGLKPGVSRPADNRIGNWIRYRVPLGVVSFLLDSCWATSSAASAPSYVRIYIPTYVLWPEKLSPMNLRYSAADMIVIEETLLANSM